ncbi:MAG: dihydropteroate synthase [Clostridia bacterium]|nr:dihydropteroate synthase [Clostridia bacterium]
MNKIKIGNKVFENYTYVMAIINLTPDSFWKESRKTADDVLFAVEKAINDGAAVIDIGAQSTRPGYTEVSAEEEISRFARPLMLIKERFDIPVSVDTYFAESAKVALSAGADMINDIWGLSLGNGMAETVAKYGASVCIMHNAKTPLQGDIWGSIEKFLTKSVNTALSAGIDKEKIILDGGIGFAKSREQNWELLNGYERLYPLGYPLLLGTSRKSMFGGNAEDRLPQTLESTRLAAEKKVLFVRVHDVKENCGVIKKAYGRN